MHMHQQCQLSCSSFTLRAVFCVIQPFAPSPHVPALLLFRFDANRWYMVSTDLVFFRWIVAWPLFVHEHVICCFPGRRQSAAESQPIHERDSDVIAIITSPCKRSLV